MKPIVTGFVVGLVIGLPMFFSVFSKNSGDQEVLGETSDVIETATPTPTPTLTPTPTPQPKADRPLVETLTPAVLPTATPSATLTPKPTPTTPPTPAHLKHFFDQYGVHYSVDSQLLTKIAWCESRFNPEAVNGPYVGLFQFHKDRWITYRTQMGHDINPDLRLNPEESIKTAAFVISLGKLFMWPNCVPSD